MVLRYSICNKSRDKMFNPTTSYLYNLYWTYPNVSIIHRLGPEFVSRNTEVSNTRNCETIIRFIGVFQGRFKILTRFWFNELMIIDYINEFYPVYCFSVYDVQEWVCTLSIHPSKMSLTLNDLLSCSHPQCLPHPHFFPTNYPCHVC